MTLANYSLQFALLLLFGIVAWSLLWPRPRRKAPAKKFRHRGPWFPLVELKALAEARVRHLSNAQLTLLAHEETTQPDRTRPGWSTHEMAGKWIRFRLRLQPPDDQPWWPVGLTVECPEFLALRDALPPPDPLPDPEQAAGHVLHLRLKRQVDCTGSLRGGQEIPLVAYVPECCQRLEVGYYGHPLLSLSRFPGGDWRSQDGPHDA